MATKKKKTTTKKSTRKASMSKTIKKKNSRQSRKTNNKPKTISKKPIQNKEKVLDKPLKKSSVKTVDKSKKKTIVSKNETRELKSTKINSKITKQVYISLVIALFFIVALLVVFEVRNIRDQKMAYEINKSGDTVETPSEVKKLYKLVSDVNCNGAYIWKNKEKTVTIANMSLEDKLNLSFSQMFQDKVLENEEITKEDYIIEAKKILGSDYNPTLKIESFNYLGYDYNIKKDILTKNINICLAGTEYISHLNKYAFNDDETMLYVNVGYVENKVLYDVNGVMVDNYDDNNKKELLAKATKYLYVFEKENENTVFKSLTILD